MKSVINRPELPNAFKASTLLARCQYKVKRGKKDVSTI